jgi:hypothetical protein
MSIADSTVDDGMPRVQLLTVLVLALAVPGCGGDDGDDGGDGDTSDVLRDAIAKTEAAKTARMDLTMSVSGATDERFTGEVVVDFEHDRDHLTMDVQGQTVELFSDGPDEYVRVGSSGRYQPLPESQQTPVANNPSDSLKYVGTDVVDVEESGESGCYEGMLDFERVVRRVEEGGETEFPEELREYRAPVLVCVDSQGRIRRYDVELSVEGTTVEIETTLRDHGRVPPLEPLSPAERPR